jgi:hypothetical protein
MCHIKKVRANGKILPQHFGGVDVKIDTRQQRSKTLDQVKLKKKLSELGPRKIDGLETNRDQNQHRHRGFKVRA